jgi:hypothetical protein
VAEAAGDAPLPALKQFTGGGTGYLGHEVPPLGEGRTADCRVLSHRARIDRTEAAM